MEFGILGPLRVAGPGGEIPVAGAKRRALLRHFGGMQGLMRAGVNDLEAVSGIGTTLARTLYDHLHPGA